MQVYYNIYYTEILPAFLVGSSLELMPTSITTAPGFSQLPFTSSVLPTAATTISACLTTFSTLRLCECKIVTVALCCSRSKAVGKPTRSDRPSTTACFPLNWTCDRNRSSKIPYDKHMASYKYSQALTYLRLKSRYMTYFGCARYIKISIAI